MLDADNTTDNSGVGESTPSTDSTVASDSGAQAPAKKATAKRAPAKKAPAKKTPAEKTPAKKTPAKKATAKKAAAPDAGDALPPAKKATANKAAPKKAVAKKTPAKKAAGKKTTPAAETAADETRETASLPSASAATMLLFKAPEQALSAPRKKKSEARPDPDEAGREVDGGASGEGPADKQADQSAGKQPDRPTRQPKKQTQPKAAEQQPAEDEGADQIQASPDSGRNGPEGGSDDAEGEQGGNRRRRRRGGRRRRKGGAGEPDSDTDSDTDSDSGSDDDSADGPRDGSRDSAAGGAGSDEGSADSRRRRRRRRSGESGDGSVDDPENTVTRVRKARSVEDEITSVTGSTRLEAKKQRRREGREAGRRRAPIVSEAEFLTRREAVDRVMVIRQKKDLTQIAVLEDKVLVEHYVARESQTSLIGNVYLARVQNVLPSMEAAFLDIGKGRNAVLYAGEVNWSTFGGGRDGGQRKIEQVLKPGQSVLVQVSKDPIGHKGARLTSQISLPGRFLVYVPDGTTSGISRKLPDTERSRLKTLLKEIVPDTAGVIVRTAAEGASEEELTHDVERLTARWADIESKVAGGNAPQLLYGEPDLTLKVVRDLFTEDFGKLVVSGDDAWDMVDEYVKHVAPDLEERLEKYDGQPSDTDVFAAYRIDEQIAKGLDRKVWLPSGGSLVIDRTEAMTVVDVNTGKFTGSGGNLEETVTKNNLEAAEEIVRQLRLRDIGGIIVVDYIDMVLESNRDLVLRRMVECLGRDRTRHQVAEVTSLGLVQMTRKRIGTGLLEAFSENCDHCGGRGLIVEHEPIESKKKQDDEPRRNRRGGRNRDKGADDQDNGSDGHSGNNSGTPSPKDVAAMAKANHQAESDRAPDETPQADEPQDEKAQPQQDEPQQDEPQQSPPRKSQAGRRGRAQRAQGAAKPDTAAPAQLTTEVAASEPPVEITPQEVVEPAAPKIVTTVRRRSARRPAGPPLGSAATPAATSEDESTAPVHVPVKKRGSRKP